MSFEYIETVGMDGCQIEAKIINPADIPLDDRFMGETLGVESSNYFQFLEDHQSVEGIGMPIDNIRTALRALATDAERLSARRMQRDFTSAFVRRQPEAGEPYSSDPHEVIEQLKTDKRFRFLEQSNSGPMFVGSGQVMYTVLVSYFRDTLYGHLMGWKENAPNN